MVIFIQNVESFSDSWICDIWVGVGKPIKLRLIHRLKYGFIHGCQSRFLFCEVLVKIMCIQRVVLKTKNSIEINNLSKLCFSTLALTTLGIYGGSSSRLSNLHQSIELKNWCLITSSAEWLASNEPSRLVASFSSNCKFKQHNEILIWK